MKISKRMVEVYSLRDGFAWGHIALVINGESVDLLVNSDYGSYAHFWTHCGINPKKFLCQIDMHYAMNKLTNGKMMQPDHGKYASEIKERIIKARRENGISSEDARSAWDEMLGAAEEYGSGDILMNELVQSKYFEQVFGDYESLPNPKEVKPECLGFWKYIWTPFVDELKKELGAIKAA